MHVVLSCCMLVSSDSYVHAMLILFYRYHVHVAFGFLVAIMIIFMMVVGIILGVLLWISCAHVMLL